MGITRCIVQGRLAGPACRPWKLLTISLRGCLPHLGDTFDVNYRLMLRMRGLRLVTPRVLRAPHSSGNVCVTNIYGGRIARAPKCNTKLSNAGGCYRKSQSRGGVSGLRSECREVPLQHLPNSEVRFNGTSCEQTDQGFIFPGACILAFPSNRNVKVLIARNLG